MKLPFIIKSRKSEEADRQKFWLAYEELQACYEELEGWRANDKHIEKVLGGVEAGAQELKRQAYIRGVKDGSAHIKREIIQYARRGVK